MKISLEIPAIFATICSTCLIILACIPQFLAAGYLIDASFKMNEAIDDAKHGNLDTGTDLLANMTKDLIPDTPEDLLIEVMTESVNDVKK